MQAVSFIYERKQWQVLDPAIEPDLAYLRTVADGDVEIVSRTLDDTYWVVLFVVDAGPARYYLYDRSRRAAQFLFSNRKALEGQPLVRMYPVVIPSRDGLKPRSPTIPCLRAATQTAMGSPITPFRWC